MTPEEIDAMPAGRAMDALVAKRVMGYLSTNQETGWIHPDGRHTSIDELPYFSTDLKAARQVATATGQLIVGADFADFFESVFGGVGGAVRPAAPATPKDLTPEPLRICRAALKEAFKQK